ncbi:alcohol dehydrogenase [Aspergillus venezuelensis]
MSPRHPSKSISPRHDGSRIEPVIDDLPKSLAPDEVLIKIHAVALNFRDVGMLKASKFSAPLAQGVPCCDCAAEVLSIGGSVMEFQVGDRMAPIFDLGYITGEENLDQTCALGGETDGVLREYAVFPEKVLVRIPDYCSWEEAATITCAGTTAWNALGLARAGGGPVVKTALLPGTGGVSLFALLICLAAGVTPIITSSSKKLERIKKLAPDGVIKTVNYTKHPNCAQEVKRLTEDKGADVVIDVGGHVSIEESFNAVRTRGTVSMVGFLGKPTERSETPDLVIPILLKKATVRGIYVGSRKDQQALMDFLSEHRLPLHTLVDTVFRFEDSEAAFKHLLSKRHVGKVLIKVAA